MLTHSLTSLVCWIFHTHHIFNLAHTGVHCVETVYDCGKAFAKVQGHHVVCVFDRQGL